MTTTTPAARHPEALATLRALIRRGSWWQETNRFIEHAIRTLERHSWVIYSGDLCTCGLEWPCPDAQSVLDAIEEAGA